MGEILQNLLERYKHKILIENGIKVNLMVEAEMSNIRFGQPLGRNFLEIQEIL
jgi:hypothetical protein